MWWTVSSQKAEWIVLVDRVRLLRSCLLFVQFFVFALYGLSHTFQTLLWIILIIALLFWRTDLKFRFHFFVIFRLCFVSRIRCWILFFPFDFYLFNILIYFLNFWRSLLLILFLGDFFVFKRLLCNILHDLIFDNFFNWPLSWRKLFIANFFLILYFLFAVLFLMIDFSQFMRGFKWFVFIEAFFAAFSALILRIKFIIFCWDVKSES